MRGDHGDQRPISSLDEVGTGGSWGVLGERL